MKIPGPREVGAVLAGVLSEPPSLARDRALAILSGEAHTAATIPAGWEGAQGPFRSDYNEPHVYARDIHSGAGNCVCGAGLQERVHLQAAPGVEIPDRMRTTAFPTRECDNCGGRMSPRWPRTRLDDGRMVCPMCAQNGPRTAVIMPKEWLNWARQPRLAGLSPHDREWHHGWDLGYDHGRASEPDLSERDRAFHRSAHKEQFSQGYSHGLHSGLDQTTSSSTTSVVAVRDDGQLRVLAHDSGSVEVIYHCFAGETRYLTKEGTKTFAETAGTVQEVLTSAGIANDRGRWAEAIIHSFGPQPVMTVRLRRNKVVKTIRATHNHEWNILGRNKAHRVVTTQDLKPGMRMAHLRARGYFYEPEHEAIRMGFVFGDGAILQRPQQTYGVAVLWGPKRDLAKYFDEVCTTAPRERTTINDVPGLAYTSGMVGYTKTLPPLTAPLEYLHGWLMGYFAADGSVTKTNISMTSSVLENLQHVRDVAILLGIGTYSITSKWRTGFGVTSQIHTLGFSGKDMGTSFFLRHDHQDAYDLRDERGTNDRERFGWTVDAIEDTGEVTPVYCARVPETGTFVLEDNIWTRNCPFCGSGQVIARSDGTVMCEFCNSSFTVQVQPEFSAFPQTVDGQPVQIPGLPPDSNQDAGGLPPDEGAPGDPTAEDNVPNDAEENGPPEDGDNTEDEPIDSGGNPLFNKHSYRTASGHALSELEYVRHLALKITPDRKNVLARIRLERAAGD